jgi:hypothetical protein
MLFITVLVFISICDQQRVEGSILNITSEEKKLETNSSFKIFQKKILILKT